MSSIFLFFAAFSQQADSSVHLPPVMPLDAPHRLPQRIRPAMLMIRM